MVRCEYPSCRLRVRARSLTVRSEGGGAPRSRGRPPRFRKRGYDSHMRRSLTSQLHKVARLSLTGRAVRNGEARRPKNIVVGRTLGKAGVGRHLWR